MATDQAGKIYRFGAFEANATTGELRKSGTRLRLQDQPFQVLVTLLERQGDIVSREELRQKLWPADTFVDFDHGLNTIVNKLREVLGDSASSPRFIETLAKRGYRFVSPVETLANGNPPAIAQASLPADEEPGPVPPDSILTHLNELPRVERTYIRVLILLIQVMYLSFYISALAKLAAVEELLERTLGRPAWTTAALVITAAVGIPIRLYLLSSVSFDVKDLSRRFLRLFPLTFLLDEIWALSPFLLAPQIGLGLALAATAALIYVPFAQRTLVLMRDRSTA
jgi:DNA-binding winged helix-turn-helix (wHTH) protein